MSRPVDRARAILALLVFLGGLGGAAALLPRGPKTPSVDPAEEAAALQALLEARLRERAAALHARVATLAELPRLAAAVATDAATVRDLTNDELMLRPQRGEALTIGQLPKGRGGTAKAAVLLVLPKGAAAAPLETGLALTAAGRQLGLREGVEIVPDDPVRAAELRGLLAAIWKVDTGTFEARLAAAGGRAEIAAADGTLSFGRAPSVEAAAPPIDLPLALGDGAQGLPPRLRLLLPAAAGTPSRGPALALGAAAVAAALLLARRSGRSGEAPLPTPRQTEGPELAAGVAPTVGAFSSGLSPSPSSLPGASGTALPPRATSAGLGPAGAPTPPQATAPLPTASAFGRYAIVRQLGSGGMADVFLAQVRGEAGFEKPVALKIMKPEVALFPGAVDHLLDEARLAARLDHPNIVQVIDLGRSGDAYFIAMEYIDGPDLERLIELGRVRGEAAPLDVALSILCHVCAGLHAAHTARAPDGTPLELVHRDVKSANVLCARNGAVKVADFGIATASPTLRSSRTEVGQVKGTPGYMAPEHRLGEAVDRRADVYGVGAIAYELLTGAPVNLDLAVLAARGAAGWPHLPPPSAVRPGLPPALDAIVAQALAYDRASRFGDCATLGDAFAAVAAGREPLATDRTLARWVAGLLEAPGGAA